MRCCAFEVAVSGQVHRWFGGSVFICYALNLGLEFKKCDEFKKRK